MLSVNKQTKHISQENSQDSVHCSGKCARVHHLAFDFADLEIRLFTITKHSSMCPYPTPYRPALHSHDSGILDFVLFLPYIEQLSASEPLCWLLSRCPGTLFSQPLCLHLNAPTWAQPSLAICIFLLHHIGLPNIQNRQKIHNQISDT